MRLKSAIWVGAYLRRCSGEGIPAAVVNRGAEDAGAVFVKVNRLDGTASVLGPAPQSAFDDARPVERIWVMATGPEPVAEADADAFLSRQLSFDPDLWVIEIEERRGRHLIDPVMDWSTSRPD
jgi:hypothetical protein